MNHQTGLTVGRFPQHTQGTRTLVLLTAALMFTSFMPSYSAAQILESITFFGSIDSIEEDPNFSGLQPGDEVIIEWGETDLSRPADEVQENSIYVEFASTDVQVSTFSGGSPGPDFFLDDYNAIGINDTLFENVTGNFFGDGIDFSAAGVESGIDFFFFNFSFGGPFSGPGGTDPTIPSDITTDPTPLKYLPVLDSNQPNPLGNGQGNFYTSDAVSFSFFINSVQLGNITGGDLLGDLNHDDTVDRDDLAIWEQAFATSDLSGDVDGDNDVDGTDFLIWQRNNGNSLIPALSSVPEPSTLIIACVGTALAILSPKRLRNANAADHHADR